MTQQWKPIESAPKDGTSILAWGPKQDSVVIAWNEWALPEAEWQAVGLEANGFECPTVVMRGEPTLWQPLPAAPCATCNDQGAVGNILTAEPCPDCTPPASAQDDAKDDSIALDKLADYIADNWPDKKYGLEEICQRLNATWPGAFMPPSDAPAAGDAQTAAARDVLAERQRQISVEGWDSERDDTYRHGELAMAAASYAQCAGLQGEGATTENAFKEPFAENWPWSETWWKPSAEPRRNLVKAGALILAEIERLDRAASQQQEG